jgi:hypothetical protein
MNYFDFNGWDRDNSSSLNLVFGTFEDLRKISSRNFLEIFDISSINDEGELQKFEYPDHYINGQMVEDNFETQIFTFNNDIKGLEKFVDQFNVDYLWHYDDQNFNVIHDNTLNGNKFSEAVDNFNSEAKMSHVWISTVVSF